MQAVLKLVLGNRCEPHQMLPLFGLFYRLGFHCLAQAVLEVLELLLPLSLSVGLKVFTTIHGLGPVFKFG